MLRKEFVLMIVSLLIFNAILSAQKPEADISFISNPPIIDGQVDGLWLSIEAHDIDLPFQAEVPTLTSATWKAAWTEEGVYVLVEVTDDVWMPSWISGLPDWASDKVELYFDTSEPLEDGLGADQGSPNLQIGVNFTETDMGTAINEVNGTIHADTYDGAGAYIQEYFVPFDQTLDGLNPLTRPQIGFDVNISDLDVVDGTRQRMVWANTGDINENWLNMDDVGLINFVDGIVCCNQPPVANAGDDQQVMESEEFVLNGSASTDDFGIQSYLWESVEGLSIPGFANVSTTIEAPKVTADADFHFVLTVYDGEYYSEKDTVTVTVINNGTTGLQNNNTIKSLSITPNPASNFANVIFESQNAGMVSIEVISSAGKVIEQKTIDSSLGQNELTIDVSDYANGMYIVLVNNGTSVQKEKMLINK